MARVFVLLGILLFAAQRAGATVSVSLPLEGRYRAGRYMPVRVRSDGSGATVTLTARGAVPTRVDLAGAADVIVPWLAASDSVRDARWSVSGASGREFGSSLHALNEDDRLVGVDAASRESADFLFPGKTIIPVRLDPSSLRLDPPSAWGSLDAVVLSPAEAARLDAEHVRSLVAAGVMLAVQSSGRPDGNWPWERRGDFWVLHVEPPGPAAVPEPAFYGPTYDWERGWPAHLRATVLFSAVLFIILSAGLLLWRSRWVAVACVALCGIWAGGIAAWYAGQSPVLRLDLGVAVRTGDVFWFDQWSWLSPIRPAELSEPFGILTYPCFATPGQIGQTRTQLVCGPDGRPLRFVGRLDPGQALAFLTRTLHVVQASPRMRPASERLESFANDLYVRPGDRVVGELDRQRVPLKEPDPVIVIDRP